MRHHAQNNGRGSVTASTDTEDTPNMLASMSAPYSVPLLLVPPSASMAGLGLEATDG